MNGLDDLLKPLDAAKEFWREAYFIAKQLNEMPLAEADAVRHQSAGEETRVLLKFFDGERHRRVMLQRPACSPHQPSFEHSKFHLDSSHFVKATDQFTRCSLTPEVG